jgi:hypothetical protein
LEHEISDVAGEGAGVKWCGRGQGAEKWMCSIKRNIFSLSMHFKLLSEVKNVNECDF